MLMTPTDLFSFLAPPSPAFLLAYKEFCECERLPVVGTLVGRSLNPARAFLISNSFAQHPDIFTRDAEKREGLFLFAVSLLSSRSSVAYRGYVLFLWAA